MNERKDIIKIAELANKKVYPLIDPEGLGDSGINFREALISQLAGNPEITTGDVGLSQIRSIITTADAFIEQMCEKKA